MLERRHAPGGGRLVVRPKALRGEEGEPRPPQCDLRLCDGVFVPVGDWEAAEASARRALAFYEAVGDIEGRIDAQMGLGCAYENTGKVVAATEVYGGTAALARQGGLAVREVRAQAFHGRFLFKIGMLAEAEAALSQGLRVAQAAEDGERLSLTANWISGGSTIHSAARPMLNAYT